MFSPQGVRPGVRTPIEQAGTEEGQPNTIRRASPLEMLAVEYFDKSGRRHETVVLIMGDRVFVPPNAEQWLFECKAASPWLSRAALEARERKQTKVAVPTEDKVDVVESGT